MREEKYSKRKKERKRKRKRKRKRERERRRSRKSRSARKRLLLPSGAERDRKREAPSCLWLVGVFSFFHSNMKYLECKSLEKFKSFLQSVDVGDYTVEGNLEAYSCKVAGADKKLSRSLDEEVASSPPSLLASSPVGPLTEAGSRRTLIYLILTLNHIYPDYDFSLLRAHNFSKETGTETVKANVDTLLLETTKAWSEENGPKVTFAETLWSVINEVISLYECDIYCYKPEYESDPFGEDGYIWSFNYFFYNKKMKRILYFSCRAKAKAYDDSDDTFDDTEDYSDRMFGEMDDI